MALYLDGEKVLPRCDSASDTTFDDTNVAYEADDVQEALEKVTKSLTYAEYEALTDAEKNNGTIYLITDINGTGDKFQPAIYSGEEREIGVWTDGRPVYAITLTTSVEKSIRSTSWTQMEFTTPIPTDIKEMVRMSFACNTQPNFYEGFRLSWDKDNHYFKMSCEHNGTFPANTAIYIEYTKTTDVAGSGTWTPQGVPAVHYSTDEHVVGTWIDGSALYEKTYSVSSSVSIGTSWSDTGFELPTNTDRIIEGFMYRNAQTGALMYCAFSIGSNNHLNAMLSIADNLDVGSSITIRYTKSS